MKNMYRVTRPAWAALESWETIMILFASLLVGVYGALGERSATILLTRLGLREQSIRSFWPIVDVVVVTFGCLLLIRCYKRLRIGCYPSTFLYCFNLPEASNPSGRSQVVGYCHVKPDMESGEIMVEGASFFWESGQLDINSRVGFESTQVRATEEDRESTCLIRFNIDKEDQAKRLYRHGLLQFRLTKTQGRTGNGRHIDEYASYLQSTQKDEELQDVEVQSKGYAERYSKGEFVEDDLQSALKRQSEVLFAKLEAMLNMVPPPTLWRSKGQKTPVKINSWGHQIPPPQSVILSETLRPHIDDFLNKVLSLHGLGNQAIEQFKRRARQKAVAADTFTLVAYERELKAGLIGLIVPCSKDQALTHRANIICKQISPFLDGDSLLDIGCGNGLIANLLRNRFNRIQLLDVVEYVPKALNLPFVFYEEGHRLPINDSFDTVLLLTVLHHSSDPVELLKLAWGATKKKLIIIESVVGVHKEEPAARYDLLNVSDEDQIAYAGFVDWFYNRVLHDNVPVPYNFTKPENWQAKFLQCNMHLAQTIYLGQDIDIGPEYHVLFVLDKQPNQAKLQAAD
jgi:SAM-dependent methyltransferase